MVQNMDLHYYNYLKGTMSWMHRYGFQYWIALWVADSVGMMSNCNEAISSSETIFPSMIEYV
jgi:hypothetical protein